MTAINMSVKETSHTWILIFQSDNKSYTMIPSMQLEIRVGWAAANIQTVMLRKE